MTAATIIVLSIGVILIIVSFLLTGKDSAEEAEEKTTPGLREELTEADKKQLKKMTDTYIREYGKKQVKDSVKSTVDSKVQEAVSQKQPMINEKLSVIEERLSMIDARSEAGVKAISDEAAAISSGWEENRREVQSVYDQITEKEKEVKIQLNLIDEYKKGLEKLKEDADSSVTRLSELQTAAEAAAAAVASAASVAASETSGEVVEENETAVEETAEEAVEAVEETAEAVTEAEEAAEDADEADADNATSDAIDEDAEADAEDDAADVDDADDDETDDTDEAVDDVDDADEVDEDSDDDAEDEFDDVDDDDEDDFDDVDADDDDIDEEEAEDEEEDIEDEDAEDAEDEAAPATGVVLPFVPGEVAESAIEDATKETLGHETLEDDEDLDEFEDEFDDDEDDLKAITNLDQILDREGIDLNAEDPTLNILTMYGAGLSIIEISKVLKMGVGEVKYIIDSNTSN